MWEEESVTVCRQQDLISVQLELRPYISYACLNSNHHPQSRLHLMFCLSDCALEGYRRTALCNPTGQIGSGGVELFSLSSSPVLITTLPPPPRASEQSWSVEVELKPFCKPTGARSLAINVSMKETLSGSKLSFSASVSGILQEEGRTVIFFFMLNRIRLIIT